MLEPSASGRSSLIGVAISLTGNILISLALNCQKLAHLRLQRQAQASHSDDGSEEEAVNEGANGNNEGEEANEQTRLLPRPNKPISPTASRKTTSSGRRSSRRKSTQSDGNDVTDAVEENGGEGAKKDGMSTDFLFSRLWWLGLGLMTLGEAGNFISYGFAPASLVAPLGAVALLSNVIIAPILLKEHFRPSDLGGILLAIIGAVTVVFSSKQSDITLNPDQLLHAISQKAFIAYIAITVSVMIILIWASSTSLGDRYILLDVGVCALFGGFTVLATKGLSSFLSLGKPLELLRFPLTYALLVILVSTALAQITFLNRALQRFDSREVIPTQFVTFTISAIVGSAILYQDFADMDAHRLINFLFGCMTTFAGVLVLTRDKNDDNEDEYEDEEEAIDEGVSSALSTSNDVETDPMTPSSSSKVPKKIFASSAPVAVPRTHPAAVNQNRKNKRRLRSQPSLIRVAAGSVPTVALQGNSGNGPGGLSTSWQELGSVPVVVARRSIFNPAFTIAYIDAASLPSTPRRQR